MLSAPDSGPRQVLAPSGERRIREHAERTYPEECCGLLFVREERGVPQVRCPAVKVVEARNEAPHSRTERYLISAAVVRQAEREAEERGEILFGVYHSHPKRPAIPSGSDAAGATADLEHLILEVDATRSVTDMRSYRWDPMALRFRPGGLGATWTRVVPVTGR